MGITVTPYMTVIETTVGGEIVTIRLGRSVMTPEALMLDVKKGPHHQEGRVVMACESKDAFPAEFPPGYSQRKENK